MRQLSWRLQPPSLGCLGKSTAGSYATHPSVHFVCRWAGVRMARSLAGMACVFLLVSYLPIYCGASGSAWFIRTSPRDAAKSSRYTRRSAAGDACGVQVGLNHMNQTPWGSTSWRAWRRSPVPHCLHTPLPAKRGACSSRDTATDNAAPHPASGSASSTEVRHPTLSAARALRG